MNKRTLALIAVGIFFFAEAIYEIFFTSGIAGSRALAWVLLGPGLVVGPLAVWAAWRTWRKSKRTKSPAAESATLNSND
jgi:divalent metal cation (Fe/Co/Zn/Cd) transporter